MFSTFPSNYLGEQKNFFLFARNLINTMDMINTTPTESNLSGFAEQITPKEYKERVYNGTFADVLQTCAIKPGDVFYVPAGRVHGIGAGAFVAEIQQTSDITYRIFDYNRKDKDGKSRELQNRKSAWHPGQQQ